MSSRSSSRTRRTTTRPSGSAAAKRKTGRTGGTAAKRKSAAANRKGSRTGGSAKKRRAASPKWHVPVLRILAIAAAALCLGVFCYWAAAVTFTPINDGGQAVGNTDVGHSLRFYLDRPSIKEAARQIGGNLVLLAPLGILLPLVFAGLHTVPRVTLVAVFGSTAVETIQGVFVPGRAFDIDDILLNVVGVIAAYLLIGRRVTTAVRGHAPS
jgi:hypothetical protein